MNRMHFIWTNAFAAGLFLSGCGSTHGDAEGYLTDHNVCRKSDPVTVDGSMSTAPSGLQELYGTFASGPRAGQEFANSDTRELWGLQLYLAAPVKPSQGLTVSLVEPDADGGAGGTVLATAAIAPGDIPAEGGWVDAQLKTLTVLQPRATYWVTVTPHYGSSDSARVSWGQTAGRGFALYSVQSNRWTRDDTKAALIRFLECQP